MLRVDREYKEKLIAPLFAPLDRGFKLSAGVLLALILWGAILYVRQVLFGLGVTGMGRPVYWSMYIVNFVFFIGISHAGTLISAILRVTRAEWRRPITRVAEAITVFALVVGSMQILIDMGRIDRLPFTFIFGRLQSPIMWDIISVTLYLLGSVTYLFLPLMPDLAIIRDNLPLFATTCLKMFPTGDICFTQSYPSAGAALRNSGFAWKKPLLSWLSSLSRWLFPCIASSRGFWRPPCNLVGTRRFLVPTLSSGRFSPGSARSSSP